MDTDIIPYHGKPDTDPVQCHAQHQEVLTIFPDGVTLKNV